MVESKNIQKKIAVIGLGYVGLPLARLFATKYPAIGFDINQSRIRELRAGVDSTLEVPDEVLQAVLLPGSPLLLPADDRELELPNKPKFTGLVNGQVATGLSRSSGELEELIVQPPGNGLYCTSDLED